MVCCLPTYIPTLHYITLHYINRHASQGPLEHYECDFRLFRATRWPWLCGQNNESPVGSSNGNYTVNLFCEKQGQIQISVEVLNFAWFLVSMTISSLFLFSCRTVIQNHCVSGLTHQSPDLLTPRSGWIILDQGELSETGPSGQLAIGPPCYHDLLHGIG